MPLDTLMEVLLWFSAMWSTVLLSRWIGMRFEDIDRRDGTQETAAYMEGRIK